MSGSERRTVVITGASSGIGLETARIFVAQGWHVIAAGRDKERCDRALAQLEGAAGNDGAIDFVRGDLSEMAEAQRLAEEITGLTQRIDVLINNAGGIRDARYVTSEGFEATLAANHLGAFALTKALIPMMRRTAQNAPEGSVRIIAVSSLAHHRSPGMNWDDLNLENGFNPATAYCQAKLANLLFTRELSRRLSDDGIIAQAMHPGQVASNFANYGDEMLRNHMAAADCDPPEKPAQTLFWVATAPEAGREPGRLFFDSKETDLAPQAQDDAAAARLWEVSESMLARAAPAA
jgi:NAD(P)-dependent dehydrogenase (short-subunit alcohol dehydrogenase family)